MCNCIQINGLGMTEEIKAVRFAKLESEVEHQGLDIADIKESVEKTSQAVISIDKSLAVLSEVVSNNSKLDTRVTKVEDLISKVNIKIAIATGATMAIGTTLGYIAKLNGIL